MDNSLISRQEAVDTLNRQAEAMQEWHERYAEQRKGVLSAVNLIEALPSAEPKWIPVSERLPEDYQDVLVWFEYFRYGDYNRMFSTYGIGNYSNRNDIWLVNHETGWKDLHVFAWMPLPFPYREGESE